MFNNTSIEMFGLCGAGKTTILNDIDSFTSSDPDLDHIHVSLPVIPGTCQSILEAVIIQVKTFMMAPGKLIEFYIKNRNLWLPRKLGYRIAGLKNRKDVKMELLADGGVLQPFVSFCIEQEFEIETFPFDEYYSVLPVPWCAIYVKASPGEAMKRYIARERKIRETRLYKDTLAHRFENAYLICEKIARRRKAAGMKVITIHVDDYFNRQSKPSEREEL